MGLFFFDGPDCVSQGRFQMLAITLVMLCQSRARAREGGRGGGGSFVSQPKDSQYLVDFVSACPSQWFLRLWKRVRQRYRPRASLWKQVASVISPKRCRTHTSVLCSPPTPPLHSLPPALLIRVILPGARVWRIHSRQQDERPRARAR